MILSKEVKVGVFAVFSITILYLGFNYLKGVDFFSSSNKYYVIYDDVGGLTRSNPVNISGFSVGRVSNIKLLQDDKNKILVELDIDSDIILGDTALAKLNADLLGSVSIIIYPGDLTTPKQAGDTLRAKVDPDLSELFMESAQPLSDNLQLTIRKLNVLLEDMDSSGFELKHALQSFTKTSNTIRSVVVENREPIKYTFSRLDKMSKDISSMISDLKPTLDNFKVLSDSLSQLEVNSTLKRVDALLEQLTLTAQLLQNDTSTFGKLMNDGVLYESLNKTISDLDTLLIHLNENPKHFLSPLGKSKKKIEKENQK